MKKTIVITGGCSGIGRATVDKFLGSGSYQVIVLDIDSKEGEKISADSTDLYFYKVNLANYEEVKLVANTIIEKHSVIDDIIHNAGISIRHKFREITPDEWHSVINTNLNSCFYVISCLLSAFRNGKGNIVFTASTNGIMGYPNYADYNVSKAGVISFTKSLALELAPKIRVNCICPGYVLTPMQRREYTDEMLKKVNDKIPLGRHAKPEEIANAFYYLVSSEADFITGTSLVIDGGETTGGLASR